MVLLVVGGLLVVVVVVLAVTFLTGDDSGSGTAAVESMIAALVPQDGKLLGFLRVRGNIALPLALNGKADDGEVDSVARDLGIEGGALYDPEVNYKRVKGQIWDWADDPAPQQQANDTRAVPAADASVPAGPPSLSPQ